MKAFVIGGTSSGSGKTSVTLGLVAALRKRGLIVQTFKVGPDFLDPTYLRIVSDRACYNLDLWMTGDGYVKELFFNVAAEETDGSPADICIVEGVMGLYDGIRADSEFGSTASIARILDLPVFLLSSCKAMARSFAATVSGFCNFEGAPEVCAVGANMAGSVRHGEIVGAAVESIASLPPFAGALVRDAIPELPSRHLGLVSADTELLSPELIEQLAIGIEEAFDIDLLLETAKDIELPIRSELSCDDSSLPVSIGIAMDEAFHFYYPDNLKALLEAGCRLVEFSPLADSEIPENVDGLYFGGGYPECKAAELAANTSMLQSIREFAGSGRVVYAECGGLMYMSEGIRTLEGDEYDMCGIFPVRVGMLSKFKTLGYVEAEILEDNIFGEKGRLLRGHEYHYSEIIGDVPDSWKQTFGLRFGRDMYGEIRGEGFSKDGVLVSYLHANFAANKVALKGLIDSIGRR